MKTEFARGRLARAASFAFKREHAANAEHLVIPESATPPPEAWSPYDVWKAFIKEARDRRERGCS